MARLARAAAGDAAVRGAGRDRRHHRSCIPRQGPRLPARGGSSAGRRGVGSAEARRPLRAIFVARGARIPLLRRPACHRLESPDVPAGVVTGDRASLRLRLFAMILAAALIPLAPLCIVVILQVRDAMYARSVAEARARLREIRSACLLPGCPEL